MFTLLIPGAMKLLLLEISIAFGVRGDDENRGDDEGRSYLQRPGSTWWE